MAGLPASTPDLYNSRMPRFVILEHDHPVLHWDLMLEREGVLRTWRLTEAPVGPAPVAAEALFDHRLVYLDYEGPVSGNRGVVRRWDRGTYSLLNENDGLTLRLDGEQLTGIFRLHQTGQTEWTFQRLPSEPEA